MKFTTIASALMLALRATPTNARYQNCSASHQKSLDTALADGIKITDLVIAALEKTICSSDTSTTKYPSEAWELPLQDSEFKALRPAHIAALIERWFGAMTLQSTSDGLDNMTALVEQNKHINELLREENTLYACVSQAACGADFRDLYGGGSVAAYVDTNFDAEKEVFHVDKQAPRIIFCEAFFTKLGTWRGLKSQWSGRWERVRHGRLTTAAAVIHESAHVIVSAGQKIDNYALFAIELALASLFDELPEPAAMDLARLPLPIRQRLANHTLNETSLTPKYVADFLKSGMNETWKSEVEGLNREDDDFPVSTVDGTCSTSTEAECVTATVSS
ncbi:hypothetical protein LTR78_003540 [Recurvomyces mirabilis]|uniref:Uncharacterized protein n=1 Tax=Recurvomyces mirabilis TaxID=574656 RepID=A0AAE0WRP2_9PEZI|nr:hypothetical protein LTR78_003540 [Recurvomyces mirabilis]KAK5154429.1 hypothetical protein LTS14_006564 [Recurvomyces mirabilis]